MHKHVNLVDLVKSFPTDIYLQNLASIQKRASPVKFAHLAEKSGKGSISNLSTKVPGRGFRGARAGRLAAGRRRAAVAHPACLLAECGHPEGPAPQPERTASRAAASRLDHAPVYL